MKAPYDPEAAYDEGFLTYARRALEMAGIETDAELKGSKPIRHSILHATGEQPLFYAQAREAVPRSDAHWEQAQFLAVGLRAAIWDLQWGEIKSYDQFAFLYWRILGPTSARYLPQLFVAACLSPSLESAFGWQLLHTLEEWHLPSM